MKLFVKYNIRMIYDGHMTVAYPECARGGGVSHILAEKELLASLY